MEVSHLLLLLLSLFALATASNSPQKSKVSGSSSEDDDTEIVTDTGITNIRTTQVRDGETTIRYSYAHKCKPNVSWIHLGTITLPSAISGERRIPRGRFQ